MSYQFQSLLYLLPMMFCTSMNQIKRNNPLSGKQLRVLAYEFGNTLILKRNATNHIIGLDGILSYHIEALAKLFNFSYSIVPGIAIPMDDKASVRGAISYIVNGDADYLLAALLPTESRLKLLDFPSSWYELSYYCIVPYPNKKLNPAASFKPLALEVWVLIVTAAITITLCLRLLINKRFLLWQSANNLNSAAKNKIIRRGISSFVWGNLVSQGQRFGSSRLIIRFVAGSWCVACFFLIQSYSSILISHLMSPNQKPIVNSIQELAYLPYTSITVDQELGLKNIILSADSGKLKLLGDKLRWNSNLICNSTTNCLATVRNENAAYCNNMKFLNSIMTDDFKKVGSCQYYLINDILVSTSAYTALAKNSPYREIVSQGVLRFKEAGLHTKWFSLYETSAWQCKLNVKRRDNHLQKLSVEHLVSAFVILFSGLLISTFAYMLEKIT